MMVYVYCQIDHKDGVWQSFMGVASDRQKTTWQTETMVNTARYVALGNSKPLLTGSEDIRVLVHLRAD